MSGVSQEEFLLSEQDSQTPSRGTRARRWWRAVADVARGPLVQAMLFTVWVGVILLTALRLRDQAPSASVYIIALVIVVCALPKVLMFIGALIVSRGLNKRRFSVERFRKMAPALPNEDLSRVAEAAAQTELLWSFEDDQMKSVYVDRLMQHAGIYGCLTSVALLLSAMVLASRYLSRTSDGGGLPVALAAAVVAATSVSFARDYGRILVRAAQRDISAQMLAWSSKRFLVTLVFAAFAAAVAVALPSFYESTPLAGKLNPGWTIAPILGAMVALLGERAATALTDRAAVMLGVPNAPRPSVELRELDGIGEEDSVRLAEEGVDSVHALAFFSTPRMFFVTKYTLQRICDWQDQALLIVRVGAQRARTFRDHLGATGATDARRMALGLLAQRPVAAAAMMPSQNTTEWEDIRKLLGFATDAQATLLFERLAVDELVLRLNLHRLAMPLRVADSSVPFPAAQSTG